MSKLTRPSFHTFLDTNVYQQVNFGDISEVLAPPKRVTIDRILRYRFYPHFHSYVEKLTQKLVSSSISGLMDADTEYRRHENGQLKQFPDSYPNSDKRGKAIPELFEELFSAFDRNGKATTVNISTDSYQPTDLVSQPHPVKSIDFSSSGAYSVYNWELFFHIPMTIAIHLSKNQQFEEAQQWFHYLFDPTDDSDGPTPDRFWKVKPFHSAEVHRIEEILVNLSTGVDAQLREDTIHSIHALKDAPFRPHVVARQRQTAYMFKTVTAYLDNLIDWGDSLFRQDTRESVDEAIQLYVLAANILGPRPQKVPKKGAVATQTYASMRDTLDKFGNTLREIESEIPFDLLPYPSGNSNGAQLDTLSSLGRTLYFCVPGNDKLLEYWDTVADRLFKIHNSLNLQGIFRQLALFDPPIDPALLARAAAAGLDISAIVSGLNQPLPLVRFQLLHQKALEICQEVKSLGGALLSAIEKEDSEALAMLRASQETSILKLAESIKFGQIQEARKTYEGLEYALDEAYERYEFYERQLGESKDEVLNSPELSPLDTSGWDSKRKTGTTIEPIFKKNRGIEIDTKFDLEDVDKSKPLIAEEREDLSKMREAQDDRESAATIHSIATAFALIPNFEAAAKPFGAGAGVSFGGAHLSNAEKLIASFWENSADESSYKAGMTSKMAIYTRRTQDWSLQSNLAKHQINQILKQLRTAEIRVAIAEREWENHKKQIKNAEEIQRFLDGEKTSLGEDRPKHKKISTQSLYAWMKRTVNGLYTQSFDLAYEVAKKAERALQYELGDFQQTYLKFNYMSGQERLFSGEKLHLDLKRMEMAYHDLNRREYELTKHVSLRQVDPLALLRLRETGRCNLALPEELFDIDGPGHYFRRIKTIAVSIPCITGPYTSLNCTLSLQQSSIRANPVVGESYGREGSEDNRFSDYLGSLQSIVTSSSQNDSGMFETNLRDERYLPFEGSGVISTWQLELPAEIRQFNYDSISDVILHIRYTAREGGGLLRTGAVENLKEKIAAAEAAGSVRLLSVPHEFPTEWAQFKAQTSEWPKLSLPLVREIYPYWWSEDKKITRAELFARTDKSVVIANAPFESEDGSRLVDELSEDKSLNGLYVGRLNNIEQTINPIEELNLYFDHNSIEDLWLALTWGDSN